MESESERSDKTRVDGSVVLSTALSLSRRRRRQKRQAFLCFSSSSLASSLPESPGVADSPAPPPCSVAMEREKRNRKQKNE